MVSARANLLMCDDSFLIVCFVTVPYDLLLVVSAVTVCNMS